MGEASRAGRRRATVGFERGRRIGSTWCGITALLLIVGVVLAGCGTSTPFPQAESQPDVGSLTDVGPRLPSGDSPGDHWHAALGVYNCDEWMSDGSGPGRWQWPYATSQGAPGRADGDTYAGLHSHGDGVIHMEPAVTEEAGRHATLGKYFTFGGWKLSSNGFDFLGMQRHNGDDCSGEPGVLKWATRNTRSNGSTFRMHTGNPADFKLNDGDVIVVAFVPKDVDVAALGDPPSIASLPRAAP